jgi:hypothetical protein
MRKYYSDFQTLIFIISTVACPALFSGCDFSRMPSEVRKSLNAAGENKDELLAVIGHFRQDKDKLEAAYYLIANLPGHYSIEGQDVFDPAFDKIRAAIDSTGHGGRNGAIFSNHIDSILMNNNPSFNRQEDIKFINAEYIKENIDLAFEAYLKIPARHRCDKATFQRFVLPYRNTTEPIEPGLRKYFFEKYSWVFDRMETSGSLQKAVCDLLDSLDIRFGPSFRYPFTMPVSNTYKIGIGNCDAMVNLVVFIFRSLGIAAACDYTPHFGNSGYTGHSWMVFFVADSIYAVDIPTKKIMNHLYKHEALPKIYRKCFERDRESLVFQNDIDVTSQYRNTVNISFSPDTGADRLYLKIFHRQRGWITVAESTPKKGRIRFDHLGENIVYLLCDSRNEPQGPNSLFYVDNHGKIKYLIPNHEKAVTGIITRKFPPFALRFIDRMHWVNSVNGAEIQAANNTDFSDVVSLKKIDNINSSNKQIIKTDNLKEYRNYRLISPDSSEIHLAGFNLMKDGAVVMTDWKVLTRKEQIIHNNGSRLINENPLSYIADRYLTVNYYFEQPVTISEFQVQARNDDNNVKPGCQYELMYWEDGWLSAGMKNSTDTLLIYEGIPSDALYWLINHTEGREEQVFLLDKDGYQYWPGVTSFNDSYMDFLELESVCDD